MSTKRMLLTVLAASAVLLALGVGSQLAGGARAQRPDLPGVTIPYPGRLTDDVGQPVADGVYDFSFALYDAETGGAPLWSEVQKGLVVQGGAFSVLLGSTRPIPPTVLDDGRDRWLTVALRGPGETDFTTLAPRQRLSTAAPDSPAAAATGMACPHDHWGETWSGSGTGLTLESTNLYGLFGRSTGSTGVFGRSDSSSGTSGASGVYGLGAATSGTNYGVYGQSYSTGGIGVYGYASAYGVYGKTSSNTTGATGVNGTATASSGITYGVYGETKSSTEPATGVVGVASATSGKTNGVWGSTASSTQNSVGVYGMATSTTGDVKGVMGHTWSTNGGVAVVGASFGNRHAAWFETGNWISTQVVNNSATAESLVVINNGGGPTGYFGGAVQVTGDVSSAGGTLKIDHPLDPANKYLSHSVVESPDRMNVYNGNVVLDSSGEAVVELPDYFEALNGSQGSDFRYQLTPIGAPAPNLYVAEEIADNRFKIAGGPPGLKVSWQVTGIRQDPWAKANPLLVEEDKPVDERGYYVHPEVYGQSDAVDIKWLRVPRKMLMLEDSKLTPSPY